MRMNRAGLCRFLRENRVLLLLLAAGLAARLCLALPGLLTDPAERFSRPDSSGYLGPALALAESGRFLDAPGGEPSAVRAPGFPVLAALCYRLFGVGNNGALAIVLILVSTAAAIPVYLAGRELGDRRSGEIAAGLVLFNLTMMAQAPMLLSDTLLAFTAALQFCWFIRFLRHGRPADFLWCILFAALGALIRPINSVWILPALVLLFAAPAPGWRRKLWTGAAAALLFAAILTPWMWRNSRIGAGFCIDTNTGAMLHQNGAMLLAKVNGTSYEVEKAKILAELERRFADHERFPDEASRVDYRLKQFKALIFAHPLAWLPQHFRPHILLPDAPGFFELLGVTRSDRGTMNVLQKQGLFAAVNHYFDGRLYLPLLLLPLLAVTLLLYAGAAVWLGIAVWNWKKRWFALLVFLAFVEYYFFLPGPVTVPRYQLPALPAMAVAAALTFPVIRHFLSRKKKNDGKITE